ncbi:DYRK-family kinase pom1 [Sesamum angolense]|uniref:DYRK-family kinase pom1 n=1 Tax=Sesamum angolense TaxID=2727404 RepID=A0AAE1WKQ1_9LAMI|nr:DYRK-family kinase pom1 [Sesamum angolense]
MAGGSWLSVSQGIAEDTSDLVSGFATIGDGLSESIDYPNEYWDSDEYEDDDDVGYMRQPIEDETWFLAHEIDYPSDNEKGTGHGSVPDPQEMGQNKNDEDDQSFAEEDSYISGEQYFQSKKVDSIVPSDDPVGLSDTEVYRRNNENDLIDKYDGQLMDVEELNLMRAEPVWQGFVTQTNELIMLGDGKVINEHGRPRPDDLYMDDEQHGSVRSIGVGINSDVADIGSEVRESLVGGSSEGDIDYFHDHDVSICGSRHSQHDLDKNAGEQSKKDKNRTKRHSSDKSVLSNDKGKSLWSNRGDAIVNDDADDSCVANEEMLVPWRRTSKDASSIKSSRDENNTSAVESANSSPSSLSNYGYIDREYVQKKEDVKTTGIREEDPGASLEDEEVVAVQEQVRQIKAQEEEFETFDLKIIHRKNRHVFFDMTGFEEDKNFHVVLNSVIAGRYHVTEYLGSAAFSKAIQAHDLHTGMDVCVKIIKNNKDFFDQSLDEIKLLKYVNKHDPADKYHILRLYDYFYYREHLLIVCELLKANLYEFHKFNRESGGEVYFTMPRLQSITIQCLEALQFLHSLGLIHCDLKPENILVKSYSRCEVIPGTRLFWDCHMTKRLIYGPLAASWQNFAQAMFSFKMISPATLLARVIGIIGPIEQEMLAKGRDTYKYFTKNHMLYERNQETKDEVDIQVKSVDLQKSAFSSWARHDCIVELLHFPFHPITYSALLSPQDTNRLEYLIPKKSSLRHRLPMGDQGFIDFVAHLLEVNPKKRPQHQRL